MTEILRWCLAVLATFASTVAIATWALRRHDLSAAMRWRSAVVAPVMAGIDFGALYGLAHGLPLNKALWWMVPALILFDAVWGYWFVRDARAVVRTVTP